MLRSLSEYHHLIKSVESVESVFVLPPSFFFEHGFIGLTRMLRSVGGTVFQTAVLSMVINPETASRVTLAYARYWLPASTKLHVCSW